MVKEKIRVELFTAPGCSKCAKAKENIKSILNKFKDKVNYVEIDVSKKRLLIHVCPVKSIRNVTGNKSMKEVVKFLAGAAAFHLVGHIGFVLWGMLPMPWFGFTLTPTINTVTIIISAIISFALAYYAWIKK